MQDNGVGLLKPGAKQMVSPFGGDGTDNIVDPNNGNRAVNSYVDLSMASTTNGGRSDGHVEVYNTMSPSCLNPILPVEPVRPEPALRRAVQRRHPQHQPLGGRRRVRLGQPGQGLEHQLLRDGV